MRDSSAPRHAGRSDDGAAARVSDHRGASPPRGPDSEVRAEGCWLAEP
jgi:hypothetical protein